MAQRDYRFRAFTATPSLPTGVKWLLISNVAVFLVYYLSNGSGLHRLMLVWLGLSAAGVFKTFMVWQIFTYMFVHEGILHILFNMLALWMFGTPLEQDWGTRRFLKYYFLCGFAAAFCALVANMLVGDWYTATVGASGAIFGLLVAFGVLYPNQIVLVMFLFPMKAKYMVMIYAAIELVLTFGPNTGVSTVAHLGGMAFGYVYLKYRLPSFSLPDFQGRYRQWKLQRAKKKFQVYMRKRGGRGDGERGPWVN